MIKLLPILLFILSVTAFSASDLKNERLMKIVDKKIGELTRLLRVNKGDPDILTRISENYLEKGRLLKQRENAKFLKRSESERRKEKSPGKYYKVSRSYFQKAQKIALTILKRNKNYRKAGNLYYVLAQNAYEFKNEKAAKRYFIKAVKTLPKKSVLSIRSSIFLATIYYNNEEYREALPLYEYALAKKKGRWWTKEAFNLAWCYHRLKKTDKAIALMKRVFKFSKQGKYIDMSSEVERALATFFTDSGKYKDAESFYRSAGKDLPRNLFQVAKKFKGQGKTSAAQDLFQKVRKLAKNQNLKNKADLELLSIYQSNGRYQQHYQTCKRLFKEFKLKKLDNRSEEVLIYHLKRSAAIYQKMAFSKRYKRDKKARTKFANYSVGYFKILSEIGVGKTYIPLFAAAETYFGAGQFSLAFELYQKVNSLAKKSYDDKYINRSLNGMLASFKNKSSNKSDSKSSIKLYHLYLSKSPRDKKAFKFYQRLFSAYYKDGNIPKAEATLLTFKKYFPKSIDKQEAMLAKLIDYYKAKGDGKGLAKWVNQISIGEIKVTQKFYKNLKRLIYQVGFEKSDRFLKTGDKVLALKNYISLYNDNGSSRDVKEKSAYNIAVLYYEANRLSEMYRWSVIALKEMSPKAVKSYERFFLRVGSSLFNQRRFREGVTVYGKMYNRLCKLKLRKNIMVLKDLVISKMVLGESGVALSIVNKGPACGVKASDLNGLYLRLLDDFAEAKDWSVALLIMKKLEKYPKNYSKLIHYNNLLRKNYLSLGKISLAQSLLKKMERFYRIARERKITLELDSLNAIANLKMVKLKQQYRNLKEINLQFPRGIFAKRLERLFNLTGQIKQSVGQILKIGGNPAVEAYGVLEDTLKLVANKVKSFTPRGQTKSYIENFKKEMSGIVSSYEIEEKKVHSNAKKNILKQDILSYSNYRFLAGKVHPTNPEFFYDRGDGVIMDRLGRH